MAVRVGTGTGGRGIHRGKISARTLKGSGVRAPGGNTDGALNTGTRIAKSPAGYLNTSLGKGGRDRSKGWR